MLTPEPIGVGTAFRVKFARGVGEAVIEDTQFDRPGSWTAVSRSGVLDAETQAAVLVIPCGSRLVIRTRLRPRGALRLVGPALAWWMRRTWDRDLARVKMLLEGETRPGATRRDTRVPVVRVPVPDLCALWAETSAAAMNIALIGVFDGAPLTGPDGDVALDTIRSFVAARLPRAPMLLRTLRPTLPGQGTPAWI